TNTTTRRKRPARGQISHHAGRRVCPRRNAPYPRRQAWCAQHQAGDRDWPFQSATRRGETIAATPRNSQRQDAAPGPASVRPGATQPLAKPKHHALSGHAWRVEARRALVRLTAGSVASGANRRPPAFATRTLASRPKGRADPNEVIGDHESNR